MRQGTPLVTFDSRGRTGNILFQAAACIGYSKKHDVPWGLPRNVNREVPRFREFFPGLPECENHYRGYQEHLDDSFCQIHNCNKGKCWFNYHPIPEHPQGVKLAGFWQSYKYFENAQEEVRKAFKLKHYEGYENAASIHIRLGDYVQYSGSFPPITIDYLRLALQQLPSVERFVIFSDDINMSRQLISGLLPDVAVEYSEGRNEYEDMSIMASCKHNIISNSTFSWWASWLNNHPDKVIISPSHKRLNWFGPTAGYQSDCIDLIPPTWHQIEFR